MPLVASPLRLSASPVASPAAPPLLGQHGNEILKRLLGLGEEELARLAAQGVIAGPA